MIHNKFRYILTLVALFAMTTGAWAQEETLLTTIVNTGDNASFTSGSKTFDNIATVTFSGSVSNSGDDYYGWNSNEERTLTVTAAEGYTITRVKFYNASGSAFDEEAPFEAILVKSGGDNITIVNGTSLGFNGVTKIEVYGYASTPAGPEVTWNKTTKQATFAMPAYDVELIPEYYPGMLTFGSGAIEGGTLEVVGLGLGTTSFTAPNEWFKNITKLASSHFEGFKSVTEEEAKAWPGVPATGTVALFYNYDETAQKWDMIYFKDGAFHDIYKGYVQQLATIYNLTNSNFSVFYTTGMQMPEGFEKDEEGNIYVADKTEFKVKATPAEGYRLVSLMFGETDITDKVDADGIATVTMPDADFALTATFSNEYTVALNAEGLSDEEAAAWKAATGDNAPAALPLENVKYGTEVKVSYTGTKKVIGVKAEKKATKLTITIPATENAAALTLDVTGCTTWEQILNQNVTTLDYEGDGVYGQTSNCYILDGNNNRLNLNTPYDPTTNYHWGTQR